VGFSTCGHHIECSDGGGRDSSAIRPYAAGRLDSSAQGHRLRYAVRPSVGAEGRYESVAMHAVNRDAATGTGEYTRKRDSSHGHNGTRTLEPRPGGASWRGSRPRGDA
jgi:hypothetical protein